MEGALLGLAVTGAAVALFGIGFLFITLAIDVIRDWRS